MDLKTALKEQYHGGLEMLRQCIDRCPDDLWLSGTHPRSYWLIAWHTLYFTHNYLVQTEQEFDRSSGCWPDVIRERLGIGVTQRAIDVEPYELKEGVQPLTRNEMLEYMAYIDGQIDTVLDDLDLEADETGFGWYRGMSKLSHELMNLRHIQGHVGQLSELLMMRDIDIDWIAKR